jgi:hypothetical protein
MKREITFDFAKWGQEGIVAYTRLEFQIVTLFENPLKKDEYYGVSEQGNVFCLESKNINMFEEVKPREFWVNVYSNDSGYCYATEGIARQALADNGQTIKVREVLD